MKANFLIVLLFVSAFGYAQQAAFTYQAVAVDQTQTSAFGKNSEGKLLSNQRINVRFSLRESSANGTVQYQETHETQTDQFGIFRLIVGRGSANIGSDISTLSWGKIPYFLEVEIDAGKGFQSLGAEEIHGAPFAISANTPGLSLQNNQLSIAGGNSITLADNDPQNELNQDVELVGTELRVTDAGGTKAVDLSTLKSLPQDLSLSSHQLKITNNTTATNIDLTPYLDDTQPTEAEVDAFVTNNGYLTQEVDGSTTNEIQDLQLSNNTLTITNNAAATNIDLTPYLDDTQPTEAEVDAFVANNGYLTQEVDGSTTNEIQDLQLNNNTLTITNNAAATNIDLTPYVNVFNRNGNTVSNATNFATDHFVFGSTSTEDQPGSTDDNIRMLFDKSKAAFRAGGFTADQADNANRGYYSAAFGSDNTVTGDHSFAAGEANNVSGTSAAAFGFNSSVPGNSSFAAGQHHSVTGTHSAAFGDNNTMSGYGSFAAGSGHALTNNFVTAFGNNQIVSGTGSFAMGGYHNITGNYSAAFGSTNIVSGVGSFSSGQFHNVGGAYAAAFGYNHQVIGQGSAAFGISNTASSYGETVIGTYATNAFGTANSFFGSDRVFAVGNGQSDIARSNVFTILKNGNTTLNGRLFLDADNAGPGLNYSLPLQRGLAGQVITADAFGNSSWASLPAQPFAIANNTVSNGASASVANDDFVFGSSSMEAQAGLADDSRMIFSKGKAAFRAGFYDGPQTNDGNVGMYSAAFGLNTTVSGISSFAAGSNNNVIGNFSAAFGSDNNLTRFHSFAAGFANNAYGNYSTAIGINNTASGAGSFAAGVNCIAPSLGEVSLGLYPTSFFGLGASIGAWVGTNRILVVGNGTETSLRSDAFVIFKNGDATLAGTLTELSDKRLKKNIRPLQSSLEKVLRLDGVNYQWNSVKPHDTVSLQTGFIAQQVQEVLPELVKEDSEGYYSVNYDGVIPHLVEAIKILKKQVDDLKHENSVLRTDLSNRIATLEKSMLNDVPSSVESKAAGRSTQTPEKL